MLKCAFGPRPFSDGGWKSLTSRVNVVHTVSQARLGRDEDLVHSTTITLTKAVERLRNDDGTSPVVCLHSNVTDEVLAGMDEAAKSQLWTANLGADPDRGVIKRGDEKYFDIVFLSDLPYPQPAVREEPGKREAVYISTVRPLVTVDEFGVVWVKVVTPRRLTIGEVLEVDRTSLSKAEQLPGEHVGDIRANTARILGCIESKIAVLDPAQPPTDLNTPGSGWMQVELFVKNSPDALGLAALLKGLLHANLVRFGR
jgi:hypothetical protein